jgi:hypothetical protein
MDDTLPITAVLTAILPLLITSPKPALLADTLPLPVGARLQPEPHKSAAVVFVPLTSAEKAAEAKPLLPGWEYSARPHTANSKAAIRKYLPI